MDMLKLFVVLLLISSISLADGFIFNGHGSNETQIGNMKADTVYNGFIVKASLTDGQPISRNGSYGTNWGQVGYLAAIVGSEVYPPYISFVYPTPLDNTTQLIDYVTINVTTDKPVLLCQLDWNGTFYIMTPLSTTNWQATLVGLSYGDYTYNVSCVTFFWAVNTSETRHLRYVSSVSGYTLISLNLWSNQTYYDVGDSVLIWTNLTHNDTYNTLYIYGSDGSTYPMTFAVSNGYWYAYWVIKQPQDYIIVEGFSFSGNITAYGEMKITYNPMTTSRSSWDSVLLTLSTLLVPLIFIGMTLLGIVIFIIFIKGRVRPSLPKAPSDAGTPFRHQVGVMGQGALGSLNNVRNIGGIFTGLVFLVFTLLAVFVILSILYYIGKVFHLI